MEVFSRRFSLAATAKTEGRRMSSLEPPQRRESVKPLDPHPKWTKPEQIHWQFFAALLVGLVAVIFEGSFHTVHVALAPSASISAGGKEPAGRWGVLIRPSWSRT